MELCEEAHQHGRFWCQVVVETISPALSSMLFVILYKFFLLDMKHDIWYTMNSMQILHTTNQWRQSCQLKSSNNWQFLLVPSTIRSNRPGGETSQYRCDHLRWRSCESQGLEREIVERNQSTNQWRFDEPMLDYVYRLITCCFFFEMCKNSLNCHW